MPPVADSKATKTRSRKRAMDNATAPAWETTRFFNDPKQTVASLPTVGRDGAVRRPVGASAAHPKFVAKARSKPGVPGVSKTISKHPSKQLSKSSSKSLSNATKLSKTTSKVPTKSLSHSLPQSSSNAPKKAPGSSVRTSETSSGTLSAATSERSNDRRKPGRPASVVAKRSSSESTTNRPVKRVRSVEDYAAKLRAIESAKLKMASLASGLVANPQQKIGSLKELRTMATQLKGRITALTLLTEAQVFRDLAPAYRIRPITEKEAAVKVSKEVLQLRTYEQALLSGYQRFIRSCISLSRYRATGNLDTPAAKDMITVRHAACKALAECLRALPHFNEVDMLIHTVCPLVSDREPEVRRVCCDALTELLANAHKASGQTLSTCVSVAKQLSVVAGQKSRVIAEEVVVPLSKIHFAGFAKLPHSQKPKNTLKKPKRSNKKLRRGKVQPDNGDPSDDDIQRDLAEGDADSTPQEMYGARKSLLDSVCHACFNIIKAASADVLEGTRKNVTVAIAARKKPPPALSAALRGLLQISRFINTDIVEAIIAALTPILCTTRYPLVIRLRSLSAAYAILGMHARSKQSEADAVTSDAREMDTALYTVLGSLYGPDTRVTEMEDSLFDAMEAVISAHSFRKLPPGRAAAMARRMCVWAAGAAITHTCSLGLVKAAQLLLEPSMVSPIFVQTSNGGKAIFSAEAGLVTEYDLRTDDPDVTNALQSAAWELSCLVHHFHPAVREVAATCAGGLCGSRLPKSTENIVLTTKGFVSNECGFNPLPLEKYSKQAVGKKPRRTVEDEFEDAVVLDTITDGDARRRFLEDDCDAFSFIENLTHDNIDSTVIDTASKDLSQKSPANDA